MPKVAKQTNQDSLDSLRRVRRTLYAIPEVELSALSLEDQISYGNALYQITTAISQLEILKLKNVNQKFKDEEQNLKKAAAQLESDLSSMLFITNVVRTANKGIELITKLISLA